MPSARPRGRRTQEERTEATTAALVTAARELFAEDGYAATSLDAVVARAGVTKGALYHHFDSKRSLFLAVFEREQRALAGLVADAFLAKRDPWAGFEAGSRAFLEASLDPHVQRITLLDAPAALGWEAMRAAEAGTLRMMEDGLRRSIAAGRLPKRPVEPLAALLFGALCEGAMTVARAEDQAAAHRGTVAELKRLFAALAA
jgi:AcrR family transcriptional regulator